MQGWVEALADCNERRVLLADGRKDDIVDACTRLASKRLDKQRAQPVTDDQVQSGDLVDDDLLQET